MKIAHISDLHIAIGPTLGVAPMAANLAQTVAHLNATAPDIVLVSGDITNDAGMAETTRAAGLLSALDMPCYITPGNHDSRAHLWQVFGGAALAARQPQHASYVVDTPAYRIIALDSSDPDHPNGHICATRAAWLRAELALSNKPVLLMLHHPPMKCAVAETDTPPLKGAALLGNVVARHPQIERILCGHIHLPVQALWHGRLVCSAPSIGMRLRFSPAATTGSAFYTTPPAYLLHIRNQDAPLITHQITLDTPPGPFPFTPAPAFIPTPPFVKTP